MSEIKQRHAVRGSSSEDVAAVKSMPNGYEKSSEERTEKDSLASKIKSEARLVAASDVPVALTLYWMLAVGLIFGGCCSNVYALEAIIKNEPDSGLLITFVQFVITALFTMPSHLSLSNPPFFLKKRAVPLRRWIPNTLLFFTVNMMNNFAFGFKISVPVHIILRSGGSVMTMLVGYVWGKRYNKAQVAGVLTLTFGVVAAAMADAQAKGKMSASSPAATSDLSSFVTGLVILFVAQLLSAIMGVYVQETYAIYGSQWHENLFYSHFLSIPLFLPFTPGMYRQFLKLLDSPPFGISAANLGLGAKTSSWLGSSIFGARKEGVTVPVHVLTLLLNSLTQYACIRGVNLLGAKTTALGVTIVLNLRKLVSLFASIWLFGNQLPVGVSIGAAIVFSGAAVYAWGGTRRNTAKPKKA